MRFNAWICKKWQVLPSNPDFQNLTDEQREWLWADYLIDNPEIQRKIDAAQDEDFEQEWQDPDNATNIEEEFEDVSEKLDEMFGDNDVARSDKAREILSQITTEDTSYKDMDWEEVIDEEDSDWEEVDD